MNKDVGFFSSSDLSESSFLYASGKRLLKTEKLYGKITFFFEDKIACEKLSSSYWSKEAKVNAKEFADSIRTLKDMIFR